MKLLCFDFNDNTTCMIDFVDKQIEMEKACDELIGRLRRQRRNSDDDIDVGEEAAKRHVLCFRNAVDVALNCLVINVGADPMPPRRRIDNYDNDDAVSNCGVMGRGKGGRETPVASKRNGAAVREKRTDEKTVFSMERIGEIATTMTSAAEDLASDNTDNKRKTKIRRAREGRSRQWSDQGGLAGGDRRSAYQLQHHRDNFTSSDNLALFNLETTFHTRHIGIQNYSGVYTRFFPLCIRHLIQFPYLCTFSCSF
jgi:hypothetical protein